MTRLWFCAVLLAVFLLVCGIAWYLFRPEKAFTNDVVNEPPPPGVPSDAVPSQARPMLLSTAKSPG